MKIRSSVFTAILASAAALETSPAAPKGQLGILTPETLAGINPATNAPWADGDTYRFAFFTSAQTNAESTDIETYNAFVQNLADLTTTYDIGSDEGVTWKVIGSTDEVDARDNTSTNPEEDGTGEPIFLLDGSTVVANDYADLWDGEIQHIINLTELGEESTWWPFTGTHLDGTKAPGHGMSFSALGGGGNVHQGKSDSATEWIWRQWTGDPPDTNLNLYALSEPLVIGGGSPLLLKITSDTGTLGFEWPSRAGKLYDLLSAPDLSTAPGDWLAHNDGTTAYENLAASETGTNTLSEIPLTAATRYFVIREKNTPPLLAEDFEEVTDPALPAEWSRHDNDAGTSWQVGTPSGTATGPVAAAQGLQCAGTNIADTYTNSADASLVTKAFTIPSSGATLKFSQYIDTDVAPSPDLGSIRLLNAADDSVLAGGDVAMNLEGITELWTRESIPLPAVANGLSVKLEFRFVSDAGGNFAGFYIDDLVVTGTTP